MREVYTEELAESMSVWESVIGEGASWGDLRARQETNLKWLIEQSLRDAVNRKIGVGWYLRSDGRSNWRNGTYKRCLVTPYGTVEIEVPRLRSGGIEHQLFDRHGRLNPDVCDLVQNAYLAGCSTRRVGEVLESVLGYRVSASTVSTICKGIEKVVLAYWRRKLSDEWEYLLLDAVVVKCKSAVGAEKRFVLVAKGVSRDGRCEILSFKQAESESVVAWEAFLEDLLRRGVAGENLKMITTDGNAGVIAAAGEVWPHVKMGRCWVHKLRNVAVKLRRRNQAACLAGARRIYLSKNRLEAVRNFREWKMRWEHDEPGAVKCLGADIEALLSHFDLPEQHRVMMRTTNGIERVFREVRRRIRTISCFTNRSSIDRIVYSILSYQNKQWNAAHLRNAKSTHNS